MFARGPGVFVVGLGFRRGPSGCFPLCQRFRKFQSEFKWKGPFRFLLTGIFEITSGGCPLISVGIFRPKFAVPFLTNRFFALIRGFGKGIKSDKTHSCWLARFNRKMPFHFPRVFPLISDRSVFGIMVSTLVGLRASRSGLRFRALRFTTIQCAMKYIDRKCSP